MFSSLKDKLFGKKKEEKHYDITNITVNDLDVGFIFDFRDESWEVTAKNYYETEEGNYNELEIKSSSETYFMEAADSDKGTWIVAKRIPIGKLGGNIREHIKKNDDPPERLSFEETDYYLDSSNLGHFFKDCEGEGDEFISWSYVDDSEKKFIFVEQWSDTQFEASLGEEIEEYQIMNILPPVK